MSKEINEEMRKMMLKAFERQLSNPATVEYQAEGLHCAPGCPGALSNDQNEIIQYAFISSLKSGEKANIFPVSDNRFTINPLIKLPYSVQVDLEDGSESQAQILKASARFGTTSHDEIDLLVNDGLVVMPIHLIRPKIEALAKYHGFTIQYKIDSLRAGEVAERLGDVQILDIYEQCDALYSSNPQQMDLVNIIRTLLN